jgi:hypothetical protein
MFGFAGEGDSEVARFQMSDASCRPRVLMIVEPQGRSVISLLGSNGSGTVGLATNEKDEISVGITRPPGIPILSVRWNSADGLQVEVWDQSEPPVIHRIILPGK